MGEAGRGVAAMLGACAIWGLSPIYFKAIAHVPPLEVLAHRVIWSVAFFGLVLGLQGRGREVAGAFGERRTLGLLAIAACMVSANWLGFIYAVQAGRTLETSLGYYIFPLVAVGLGFAVLGERFTPGQAAAIALAATGVAVLAAGLGAPPWIALLLAGSFGVYGLVKGRVAHGPVVSVFVETALVAPLAAGWLLVLHAGIAEDPSGRPGAVFLRDVPTSALLLLSGAVMTGGPLILFSYATRRLSYATVGLIQYMNPTLQFAVAVALFGEVFTRWHAIAFPLIWTALALYSLEAWRRERRARRSAMSAATVV